MIRNRVCVVGLRERTHLGLGLVHHQPAGARVHGANVVLAPPALLLVFETRSLS